MVTGKVVIAGDVDVVCGAILVDGRLALKLTEVHLDLILQVPVQVMPHHAVGIGEAIRVLRRTGIQQQARGLHSSAADHDDTGLHFFFPFRNRIDKGDAASQAFPVHEDLARQRILAQREIALVQVVWLLGEIRRLAPDAPHVFVDWPLFQTHGSGLFVWEAFVSGASKGDSHAADALAAVRAFAAAMTQPLLVSAVTCPSEAYSLLGAALLRTGWSSDLELLSSQCTVIRATERGV